MSVFDRLLNKWGSTGLGFSTVNPTNPVDWVKLGTSVAAALIGGFVLGLQSTVNAVITAIEGLLRGGTEFLFDPRVVFRFPSGYRTLEPETGLIPMIRDGLLGVVDAVWAPFAGFGWLSFPVAVAALLLSLYPILWAIGYVREEVI